MKLRNRLLLVLFGVLIFLVATPILVLFTQGYEIDWANHKLVKTGTLVVKTLPTKAIVLVDNIEASGTTPENVRFLLPGAYNVRIEKDGYQSWTKRLTIRPQLATWANEDRDFVTLFLAAPKTIGTIPVKFASQSKNADEIAYIQQGTLHVYNTSNQKIDNLGNIDNFKIPFTFSSNLVWSNAGKLYQYFFKQPAAPFDPTQIRQTEANGQDIGVLYNDQLYTISNQMPLLIDKGVSGFTLDGENIWYVQGTSLKRYNLRTQVAETVHPSLPQADATQIIRGEGHTFLILNNSLYILNDTLEKIYDGANFARYDLSSHKLLFTNNNEILIYDPQRKNSELVLRSISPIANAVLNDYTGYVFFLNENKIKAIELDGRDHRNIYTILDLTQGDAQFALSGEGDTLTVFNDTAIQTYKIR